MQTPLISLSLGLFAVATAPLTALAETPAATESPSDTLPPIAPTAVAVAPSTPALFASAAETASTPKVGAEAPDISADQPQDPAQPLTHNPVRDTNSSAIALNFDPPTAAATTPPSPPRASLPAPSPAAPVSDLFTGGSESIVGRTVGAAEGTRTVEGGKTDNYYGHRDPGNGVWNRGTFSYQFGNAENLSMDEADRRQMAKIQHIYESVMLTKAAQYQVAPLTLSEELNGIDLINQAPLAMTEAGGYIERLAEAKTKEGLGGDAAILEARVWAFWDPQRQGWDAPGLRAYDDVNKEASIRHDQARRMGMIAEAIASYQEQHGAIVRGSLPSKTDPHSRSLRSPLAQRPIPPQPQPQTKPQPMAIAPPRPSMSLPAPPSNETVAHQIIFQSALP